VAASAAALIRTTPSKPLDLRDAHAPVQVVWTREMTFATIFYRPPRTIMLHAGLDLQNNLIAWRHRATSPYRHFLQRHRHSRRAAPRN